MRPTLCRFDQEQNKIQDEEQSLSLHGYRSLDTTTGNESIQVQLTIDQTETPFPCS